jgi:CRISPR-associated endoribonuclease Cas6
MRPVNGAIAAGDCAWVRLVGLRADVVAALDFFEKKPPEVMTFDRKPWRVEQVTWRDHPWAGQTSYRELAIRAQRTHPPDSLTFEFASPTAFSSADLNIPLPDPMRVFDSLRARWAALSTGFVLPEALMEFVRRFVPLTEFRAHSEKLMLKTLEIGFCASRVRYTIKPPKTISDKQHEKKPDEARMLDALNAQRDDLARAVALLGEFAFYGGVGIKTTSGMGMVRQI